MFASPVFDVAGPGVLFLVGGTFFAIFSISTLIVETLALWLLKWDSFGRSLLASFLMNLASSIVGFVLFGILLFGVNYFSLLLIGFVLSVLIEGGVLLLMKRGATRQNWIASLIANAVSYGLLAILLLIIYLFQ